MAGNPAVAVKVLADLKGFTTAVTGAGTHVDGVTTKMRTAFSGVTGALNQTGVLGPFSGVLDGINATLDTLDGKAKGLGTKLLGVGAAATGVGAGLSAFGSKDQAAQQQLQQAIENTGGSYDDYGKAIEDAISHGDDFGHTADQTQDALRKLTDATHDPQKALDLLGEANDLAAAKHDDLSSAATKLGKVYNGNTKLLKEFGITIDKTTGLTKDGKTATEALAQVVGGQAAQAADTFTGKLDAIKAHVEDSIAQFGQKWGPAIQVAGIGMAGLGAAMEVLPALFGALSAAWGVLTGIELASLGPILLIIAAVAALIAIGWVIYQNWDTIWSGIQTAITVVWDWITGHWPLLLDILLGPIGLAATLIIGHWDDIKAAAVAVWDWITTTWSTLAGYLLDPFRIAASFIGTIMDGFLTAIKAPFNAFAALWNALPGIHIGGFSIPDWVPGVGGDSWDGINIDLPHITPLATGGLVTDTGLFLLHAGEAVTPASAVARTGPVVHIDTVNMSDDVDLELLTRKVAWAARTAAL